MSFLSETDPIAVGFSSTGITYHSTIPLGSRWHVNLSYQCSILLTRQNLVSRLCGERQHLVLEQRGLGGRRSEGGAVWGREERRGRGSRRS